MHDIGYKVVQVSGVGDIPPEKLKEICDRYDMVIACTHKGLGDYNDNLSGMIEYHKKLGTNIAGFGFLPSERRNTIDDLKNSIEIINNVYDEFKKNGMTFAYHNHAFEFSKVDGKYLWDIFVEYGKFDFIIDTFWIAYAGLDPAKVIKLLGDRVKIVHFKDLEMRNDNQSYMAEVGNGNLDWDSIINASQMCEYALVEQDICKGDPFDSMKISYDFLTKKGFI